MAHKYDDGSMESLYEQYEEKPINKYLHYYKVPILIAAAVIFLTIAFFVVRGIIRNHASEKPVPTATPIATSVPEQTAAPTAVPAATSIPVAESSSAFSSYEFYKSLLPENVRSAYELLYKGLSEHSDSITVNCSASYLDLLCEGIRLDHPELFWFSGNAQSLQYGNSAGNDLIIVPTYYVTATEAQNCQAIIEQAKQSIAAKTANASDYEIVKAVHQYIIENTTYKESVYDQGCYSLFVDNESVCAGYSCAFKLLLDQYGIPCIVVFGTADGGPHAWNMVCLDGNWYHVDCTWDDPVMSDGSQQIRFDYFLIDDSTIFRDHTEDSNYIFPSSMVPCKERESDSSLKEGVTQTSANASSFDIRFLDVGQGDSTLVLCDGYSLLIDGGSSDCSSFLYSYLKNTSNLTKLDYVVSTHPHADHVGGLSGALKACKAGTVYSLVKSYDSNGFRSFIKYADSSKILIPKFGDSFKLGSATCTFLTPDGTYEDLNAESLVLRIVYGNTSFLCMADATAETEKAILNTGCDVKSTLLRVGHHGSDSSTSYVFLRDVLPEYAVISVGENEYGHPTENVLSRLSDCGAEIYRTDVSGTICCTSNGQSLSFETEKGTSSTAVLVPGIAPVDSSVTRGVDTDTNDEDDSFGGYAEYIGNKNSKKFHYPDCSAVKKMNDKNKIYISSREEAISNGYIPCKICNP